MSVDDKQKEASMALWDALEIVAEERWASLPPWLQQEIRYALDKADNAWPELAHVEL